MLSSLDLLHLARSAADRAAGFIRSVERPADPAGWGTKSSRDFVTEVDRTAERMIAEILLAGDPRATIVGEELTPTATPGQGVVWVVDPLDGTTNFLHAYPAYAVSIAAAVDGVLEVGVVHDVPHSKVYWATRGGGAWCDERRLRVSPIASPDHALIGTGFPFKDLAQLAEYQLQFARVAARTTGIRRAGAAALDLADVAAGRFEGFWEQRLSAWDIAAGALLIREAGGRITDPAGRDLGIEHTAVVAGNPAIHAWLLETLGVWT
jgi:myo-inositol-1(or 4)-monophosphatase